MARTKEKTTGGRTRGPLVIASCVTLAAALAVGLWWWNGRQATQTLAEAVRAAAHGRRYDEALAAIDRWAAVDPKEGGPHFWKAKVALARDDAQGAVDALKRAAELKYDPVAIQGLRGVMLARAGKLQEAEPLMRRALARSDGPEPELAEGLSRVYLGTFQLGSASAALDRWVKDDPEDARPHLWRNEIVERSTGDDSVQIRNFRMALQRDPNLDKARIGLADKLREGQRNAEALEEYRRHLDRNPGDVPALVGAGQTALQSGDVAEATRWFDEALAKDPREPTALRELAILDLRSGKFERARDRLATVVEVDPHDPEVRSSYARALKMSGDDAGAAKQGAEVERLRREHRRITDVRKALVENPNDLNLKLETARWLLDHGHDDEGLEWAELILKERPGHPPTCKALAEYHAAKGNLGLANYYKTAAGLKE